MKQASIFTIILSACVITVLFHRQPAGLNVLIFQLLFIGWLLVTRQFKFEGINPVFIGSALVITSVFTVLTYSDFTLIINFVTFILFIGILVYPKVYSITNSLRLSLHAFVQSQLRFIQELTNTKIKGRSAHNYLWSSVIFVIPSAIIIFFIWIYRLSNPVFDKLFVSGGKFIREKMSFLLADFDFLILATFFVGIVVSNFSLFSGASQKIIEDDQNSTTILYRLRKKRHKPFEFIGLKNEFKSGIFLLLILNIIIFILNTVDIYWVWFNFNWEGQYLKQFVHEGTYLLILSILLSIGLVLYYFRGNLNFYSGNRLLKVLCYVWLFQNSILIISVAIRNYWYIQHFALAYKRIGVFIFLLMTLYGLYTVFVKVRQHKSNFFLYKANSYAVFLILIVSSLVNWDTIIARYNFNNYERSFVHLNYLVTLPDKSLPYLDKSLQELKAIEKIQKAKFDFNETYMNSEEYFDIITSRKAEFEKKWKSKTFLSWNLPEHLAYRKLFKNPKTQSPKQVLQYRFYNPDH